MLWEQVDPGQHCQSKIIPRPGYFEIYYYSLRTFTANSWNFSKFIIQIVIIHLFLSSDIQSMGIFNGLLFKRKFQINHR